MGELQRIRALVQLLTDELALPPVAQDCAAHMGIPRQDLLPVAMPSTSREALIVAIRRYAKMRRKRGHYLQANVFADPAWDILLDLFAASLEEKRVSVSSACIAADVPPTTALRWLTVLEKARMVERLSDPQDRRRTFVRITPAAAEGVAAWFGALLERWEAVTLPCASPDRRSLLVTDRI